MINHTAVARRAAALERDVVIACAGTEGEFSADDICAAGAIATSLCQEADVTGQCDLTRVARILYRDWREGRADLSKTYHYARLVELGFEEDVRFCLQEDITEVAPLYQNGIIHS